MRSLNIFIVFSMIMAFSTYAIALSSDNNEESYVDDNEETIDPESSSLQGITSRFLAQRWDPPRAMTCDQYPRVCRAKGSPGPDCCRKKCVNVSTDKANCGKCGKYCKYPEICCHGACVNPMSNKKHCGGCNKKCKKGSTCAYGMCSYA